MEKRPNLHPSGEHQRFGRSPLLNKMPILASGVSAMVYFTTSEGIQNYLAMLISAVTKLARLVN